MSTVSVILPSYNVSGYIEACLESVIIQTYDDLEILCIDAGSNDGTLEIINKYASNDQRVRVIVSDKKSYGSQVNIGIREAIGEYICIVETDDTIEPDMIRTLYQVIVDTKADYVKGRGKMFYELPEGIAYNADIYVFDDERYADGIIDVDTSRNPDICLKDYYLWTGIYRKEIIRDIKLNETSGAAYQDVGFLFQLYRKCKKAIYIDKNVYNYRKDNENASTYNINGFKYLLREYAYVDSIFGDDSFAWKKVIEQKLVSQVLSRMKIMAYHGHYCTDIDDDIEMIKERLRQDVKNKYISILDYEPLVWYEIGLFLENSKYLFNYYGNRTWNYQMAICDTLNLDGGKKIIFGTGKKGKYLSFYLLRNYDKSQLLFCDNDNTKVGTFVNGIRVISVHAAALLGEAADFIVSGKYSQDMKEQLIDEGINEKKIIMLNVPIDYNMFLFTDKKWKLNISD